MLERKIVEPLTWTKDGPVMWTRYIPCHCVREKVKSCPISRGE